MTPTTLPRVTSVQIPETLASLDADLLRRAADRLGYHGEGRNSKPLAMRTYEVHQKLLDIGVKPFNQKAVENYKTRVDALQFLKPLAVTLVAVALFVTGWIVSERLLRPGATRDVMWFGSAASALVAILCAWLYYEPVNWSWQEIGLGSYSRPIPAHVLSVALQVADAFGSNAAFRVDEYARRRHREVADPFLILNYNGVEVVIAAWDEPSFTAKSA